MPAVGDHAHRKLRARVDRPRQLRQQERVLAAEHWAHHKQQLPALVLSLGQALERRVVRLRKGALVERPEPAAHRAREAPVVDVLPAVTHLVGDPPLVDRHVGAGLDAVELALVVLEGDVVARGRDAVNRRGSLEEPHALGEEEVLVEQRTNGAEVDHVRRQLVVQRHAREDIDLALVAAPVDGEFGRPRYLAREPHAAGAHDAPVGVDVDVGAEILLGLLDLGLLEARHAATVLEAEVLQVALARLIADRAVERVVDQQVLHNRLLVGDGSRVVGIDHHPVAGFGRAGRLELAAHLGLELALVARIRGPDLAQTDPALGRDRQGVVVAVVRDFDVVGVGDLEDLLSLLELALDAVNGDLGHGL